MRPARKLKNDYFFPIRWKLIIYFLIFMILLGFIGLYVNLGLKMSARLFKGILDEYQYLETLGKKVYALKYYTENYLTDDSLANLEKTIDADLELREELEEINNYLYFSDNEVKYHSYLDLTKCIESFINLSEKTITTRRNGLLETAYLYNYKMNSDADLISKYLAALNNLNTTWGNERFVRLIKQSERIEHLAYSLAAVIGLLSIVFCINFALGITQPLEQMAKNARQIGEGDFSVKEISAESGDEVQIIAGVFNRMSRNIQELFNEIQQKAMLERELEEEKMHNLEIKNLLRETEIQILQSQINPHFLFNTLNAISQVAILEDATETGKLIKAVARLLRYNMRSLDRPVTVMDEVNHIKEYIYITGIRYGDRVDCKINCSGDVSKYLIPCMTLQPIVENAYIHGVAELTGTRGEIRIEISVHEDYLQIVVADNGIGIPPSKLDKLLASDQAKGPSSPKKHGKTNGLGLVNIRKRLELFYKRGNLVFISSQPKQGTQVILKLPLVEEDDVSAQFDDCG